LQGSNQIEARSATEILAGDPSGYALFLDVDGTLLEIAPTPEDVTVPAELAALLGHIAKGLDGALAIITGRQLAEIDALLAPAKLAGAGVHGAELRLTPGGEITAVAATIPKELVDEITQLAQRWPGAIIEPKGPGLAIHYRQAPTLKPVIEAELEAALARHRNGSGNDLVLSEGRKLFEVVPAGQSKGTALTALAALPQFRNRIPIMIGDDAGDEPAFAAAAQLGGIGLRVGGEHFGQAKVDLDGPQSVLAWLTRFAAQLDV
jgi:trehalose 6-phosphate phosphatase